MTTDNQSPLFDKPVAQSPAVVDHKTDHDAIKSLSDLVALLKDNAVQPDASLEHLTFDALYRTAVAGAGATQAKADAPLRADKTPQTTNVLDFSAKDLPSIYGGAKGKIADLPSPQDVSAENARPGSAGSLEIPLSINTNNGRVTEIGKAVIPHLPDGPSSILDSHTRASSNLHFANDEIVTRTPGSDLANHFVTQKNAGTLADDPLWQSYVKARQEDKVGDTDWYHYVKEDSKKFENTDNDAPKLQQKLTQLENDPDFKKQMEELQRKLADNPIWKESVERSEVKALETSTATEAAEDKLRYVDKHSKALEQVDNLNAQKQAEADGAHKRLGDWAEAKLQEPEKSKFQKDMVDFEQRARRDGLSPEQIAETYKQIERLNAGTGDKPLSELERQHLVQQVMHQAADPTSIDQGHYNSCNVTTVETRTYTRSPADAARLVADVALTGQYRATDGTVVKIDATPHGQSHDWPTRDNERSHASEIFQVTAINIHYAKQNAKDGGNMSYKQIEPPKGDNGDTGERLVDGKAWFFPDAGHEPGLYDNTLTEISNSITGKNEKDVEIADDKYVAGSKDNIVTVKSEEELKEKLKELKEQHRLPIIVKVNSRSEPFYSDSGQGSAGGSGGAHVVTITDYDEKTGNVCIDNQWGKSSDHDANNPVNIHDLYFAMQSTGDAEKLMAAEVQSNREHGTVDPVKELELLRYQKANHDITDEQFAENLKKATMELQKRWEQEGVSEAEKTRESKELGNLIHTLPPEVQIGLVQAEHNAHLIDDGRYRLELMLLGFQLDHDHAHATRIFGLNPLADHEYSKKLEIFKAALAELPSEQQKELLDDIAKLKKQYP